MLIRITTGQDYSGRVVEEIINSNFIRSIKKRENYGEGKSTIEYIQGTKGHWESRGANTIIREIHTHHSLDELAIKLGIS